MGYHPKPSGQPAHDGRCDYKGDHFEKSLAEQQELFIACDELVVPRVFRLNRLVVRKVVLETPKYTLEH